MSLVDGANKSFPICVNIVRYYTSNDVLIILCCVCGCRVKMSWSVLRRSARDYRMSCARVTTNASRWRNGRPRYRKSYSGMSLKYLLTMLLQKLRVCRYVYFVTRLANAVQILMSPQSYSNTTNHTIFCTLYWYGNVQTMTCLWFSLLMFCILLRASELVSLSTRRFIADCSVL